jgi:hypothetical protein
MTMKANLRRYPASWRWMMIITFMRRIWTGLTQTTADSKKATGMMRISIMIKQKIQDDSPAFAYDYTTEGPSDVLPAKATSKDTPSDLNHSSTYLLEAVIEVPNPNCVEAFWRSIEKVSKLARPGSWN